MVQIFYSEAAGYVSIFCHESTSNNAAGSAQTGAPLFLTKCDTNAIDDRGMYNKEQMWLSREDIGACVKG